MFYRNSFISKPRTSVWSDGSVASQILIAEFFGVDTPPAPGFTQTPMVHMMAQSGGLM